MDGANEMVELDVTTSIWSRVFVVAPLVLVGTQEKDGTYNLAPKHMATPLGWGRYWGFVCTPGHTTYHNARRHGAFTVSYPRPSQVLFATLAAAPRTEDGVKASVAKVPTFSASCVDGILVSDAYLYLECELERTVDGFGDDSLVVGRIVAARVREEALRTSDRDDNDLLYREPLLAYLSWGRFAEIRESQQFPLPEGFRR
jgi:flavin reductase (DIM6/NTAB) family NADH-FMN oxidoreductase RutF